MEMMEQEEDYFIAPGQGGGGGAWYGGGHDGYGYGYAADDDNDALLDDIQDDEIAEEQTVTTRGIGIVPRLFGRCISTQTSDIQYPDDITIIDGIRDIVGRLGLGFVHRSAEEEEEEEYEDAQRHE
jgi:hypothetical protein